jgi:hypothetical protein
VSSPKGTKLWDDFKNLKKLRDRIIHLKNNDITSSGPDIDTVWGILIRSQKINFPKQAHELIGHYISNQEGHRWFKKYPYY